MAKLCKNYRYIKKATCLHWLMFYIAIKSTYLGHSRTPQKGTAMAFTITTFNILAAVHRSMDTKNSRESERREWWQPRAENLGHFIVKELASSDVVLLQEWWFRKEFEEIFDNLTGGIFERVSERRPGGEKEKNYREDGMAVLVNKKGKLKLVKSEMVRTGPQRIAQIVHCEERINHNRKNQRLVLIANAHLSFPGGPCSVKNSRKQAYEAVTVARALEKYGNVLLSSESSPSTNKGHSHISKKNEKGHLQIIAGDFNSNSNGLAASRLMDKFHFVNCASATAEQTLCSGSGGRVNLGVTHRTHLGEDVSVDHLFARFVRNDCSKASNIVKKQIPRTLENATKSNELAASGSDHSHLRNLGYLSGGVKILNTQKRYLQLDGDSIISDHRPVTAYIDWPLKENNSIVDVFGTDEIKSAASNQVEWNDFPLDPLEPPWPMT